VPHIAATFGIAAALLLAHATAAAQCSGDEDTDATDCQTQAPGSPLQQQSAPILPPGSARSPEAQQTDRTSDAMTTDRLTNGATYSDQRLPDRSMRALLPRRPPAPLTEFQRFVAASTGQVLAIYGADLFTPPATFAPIEHAPAPADMMVGPDDELRVRIWGQINYSANLRVSREGDIYLPKVGAVHVAGLPFSRVADHVRAAVARIFRNFDLSVDLGEIHSIQVYVAGQAQRPGEYTVSALSTLVDAIFATGGPSSAGSMRHVELKRDGRVITDFDLYALLIDGNKAGDQQLQAGDVLYIPAAGPQVALLGSVRQPGIYELRGDEPVNRLIQAAGGLTALASDARLSIERIADHRQRSAFTVNADAAGLTTILKDGDIVRINAVVSSYADTVTLRGSVANPGHFRWHAGMRLSELLPDRDALLTRDYWWQRVRLGLPAPEFMPAIEDLKNKPGPVPPYVLSPDSDRSSLASSPSRADRQNTDRGGQDQASSQPGRERVPTMESSSVDSNDTADMRQDAQRDHITPQGAVHSPEDETNWNYAVIERVDPDTMMTSLIPFDLGKLVLRHDSAEDHELRPGDVVTIFSQEDIHPPAHEQTIYVRLEGEFVHPGVYSAAPGETLRSLVQRAGGLTDMAYLFGAVFTRRSTKAIEQKRLGEYADELEHQWARSSISMGSSAMDGSGTGKGQIDSVANELLAQLRRAQPSGRIVLHLDPAASAYTALPDISMEDGDRLIVPQMPATVQVIGAVANQSAYFYSAHAAAERYLRMAGGPNRDADRSQIFILRADGSVVRRPGKASLFSGGGLDKLRMYPGDTVIVPEKKLSAGGLRELVALVQVASQLSLGAAAIDAIH
jgi:protein involved in polysaccharide export with SLBB domain